MLMNLGSLVTITARAPRNLTLILFDNGVYEVTGAQLTPGSGAAATDGRNVDFAGLARASGFERVYEFDELDRWRQEISRPDRRAGAHVHPRPRRSGSRRRRVRVRLGRPTTRTSILQLLATTIEA